MRRVPVLHRDRRQAIRAAVRLGNPNCLWSNGDNGKIASIDAFTGNAGCASPNPTVKIPYTNVVPRLSCAKVGRIRSWQNITLTPPPGAGVDVTTVKLTVDTAGGTAVPGFVDLHPDASGAIDLSTLAVADTGTQPTFLVTVPGVTTTQAAQLSAAVTYTSDPPQICYTLTTRHHCPTLAPGLSGRPDRSRGRTEPRRAERRHRLRSRHRHPDLRHRQPGRHVRLRRITVRHRDPNIHRRHRPDRRRNAEPARPGQHRRGQHHHRR